MARLPVFELRPVPGWSDHPAWALSSFRDICRVPARDAAEARRLADGRFLVPIRPPEVPSGAISPWLQPHLVTVVAELGPPGPTGPPPLALVVEDQALVAFAIENCLAELGYRAILVREGRQARAGIEQEPGVSLLVTGLRLTDGHGGAVIEVLWERWPGTPVLVSTGAADLPPPLARKAAAGMLAHLAKPWQEVEFIAAVHRLGRWPQGPSAAPAAAAVQPRLNRR